MSLKVSLQNEVDKLERLQGQGFIVFREHLSNLLCDSLIKEEIAQVAQEIQVGRTRLSTAYINDLLPKGGEK